MDGPLDSIRSPGLLAALMANLIGFWRDYGRAPGAEMHESADLMWFATGFPSPALNRMLRLNLRPATVESAIDRIEEVARRRQAPMLLWVAPDSAPRDLPSRLRARGAAHRATAPGMAVNLAAVAPSSPIEGFRIELADRRENRRRWGTIAAEWFGAEAAAAFGEIEQGLDPRGLIDRPRYLGFLNGEAMASAALVLEGGVAGVYLVATEPSAQRRGIGRRGLSPPRSRYRRIARPLCACPQTPRAT